jgi:hypothetical protein
MPHILVYGSKYSPISMCALKAALLQAHGELIDDVITKIFAVMVDLIDLLMYETISINSYNCQIEDYKIYGKLCGTKSLIKEVMSEFLMYDIRLPTNIKSMIDCEFITPEYYELWYDNSREEYVEYDTYRYDIVYGVLIHIPNDISMMDSQFGIYSYNGVRRNKKHRFMAIAHMEHRKFNPSNVYTFDDVRASLVHSKSPHYDAALTDSQLIAKFKALILSEHAEVKIVSQFGFVHL